MISKGPNIDPCGMPHWIIRGSEMTWSIGNLCAGSKVAMKVAAHLWTSLLGDTVGNVDRSCQCISLSFSDIVD